MSAYKIAALQKALDDSVPSSDLERANKQYTELTVKYRDVLQRDSRLIQRTTNLEHLEVSKHTCTTFISLSLNCGLTTRLVLIFFLSLRVRMSLSGSRCQP